MPALTAGIVAGLARLRSDGGGIDALMAVTFGTWLVYGVYLLLRYEAGWRGRRTAYLALGGVAFVIAALVPVSHF